MLLRHLGPGLGNILYHLKQRLVAFAEVGHFNGPIIHFGIDIHGVFTIPRWIELVVPFALQVGRMASRTATRNEQVACELYI
ncbi:hypothetical protein D3C87_2108430 [compost metagenome]